jgi:hypothetical protein
MRHLSRRRLALDAVLFLLLLGLGLALSRPAGPAQRPAADARVVPIDTSGAPGAHTVRKGYSLYRRAPEAEPGAGPAASGRVP